MVGPATNKVAKIFKPAYDVISSLRCRFLQLAQENNIDLVNTSDANLFHNELPRILKTELIAGDYDLQILSSHQQFQLGQRMATSILYRFSIFFHVNSLKALSLHVNGVFGTTEGFLVEYTTSRNKVGSAAGALQIKILEMKFGNCTNYNIVHAEGLRKLQQSKRCRDTYIFQYCLDVSARAVYVALSIHCAGMLASVLSQIDKELEANTTAIRHSTVVIGLASPAYSSDAHIPSLSYHLPASYIEYFRSDIWTTIMNEVVKCAESHAYERFSTITESNEQDFVPSTLRRRGLKLPVKTKALDDHEVIKLLFDRCSSTTQDFWYSIASLLLEMLLMKGMSPITELQNEVLDERYVESVSEFLCHIQQLLIYSVPQLSLNLTTQLTSDEAKSLWLQPVMDKLKIKPLARMSAEVYETLITTSCPPQDTPQDQLSQPQPQPQSEPQSQPNPQPHPQTQQHPPDTASVLPQRAIVLNINPFDIPGTISPSEPQEDEAEHLQTIEESINKALNPSEGSGGRPPQHAYLLATQPDSSALDNNGCCTNCKFDWKSLKEGAYIFAIPQHEKVPQSVVRFISKYAIKPVSPSQVNDHVQSIKPSVMSPLSKKRTASEMLAYLERREIRGPEDLPDYDELSELRKRAREEEQDIILHDVTPVSSGVNISTQVNVGTSATRKPASLEHGDDIPIGNRSNTIIEVAPSRLTIGTNNDNISDDEPIFVMDTRPSRVFEEERDYSLSVVLCNRKCDHTFDINDLLTLWARAQEFSEDKADTTLWTTNNVKVKYGPLSLQGLSSAASTIVQPSASRQHQDNQCRQRVYRYNDNLELMATMQAVICRDIHNELSEIFWDSDTWENLRNTDNILYELRRDTEVQKVRVLQVSVTPPQTGGYIPDFQQYDVVTIGLFIEPQRQQHGRQQRRRQQPIPHDQLLGIVTGVKLKKDEEEALVNITVLGGQRRKKNTYEQSLSSSSTSMPPSPTLAALRRSGFLGTEIRQSIAFRAVYSFSRQWVHILLNNEFNRSEIFGRIDPFENSNQPSPQRISTYISEAKIDAGCSKWMQFLATNTSAQQHSVINASQIAAICETLQLERDCHKSIDKRRHKIPFLCLVGPAGTGKTYTILQLINTLYHHSDVGYTIYNMQVYVTLAQNRQNSSSRHNSNDTSFIDATFIPPEEFLSILIVTETHAALDVIEERLLEGFGMLSEESNGGGAASSSSSSHRTQSRTYKCLPTYTRVGTHTVVNDGSTTRQRRTPREAELDRKRTNMPRVIRRRFRGCIVLSTFGSLRKAFESKCFLKGRQQNRLPQYDLVIVDEASMVGKKSLGLLAHYLSVAKTNNAAEVPIVIAGDPMQVPPHSSGKRDIFTDLSSLSVMHEMIPSATAITSGPDLCHYVQLDTQYRMHPTISQLSNIVAERKVFDGGNISEMKGFKYTQHRPQYRAVDLCALPQFEFTRIAYPVVWIDPYAGRTRIDVNWLQDFTATVNVSRSEATNCVKLAKELVDGNHFRPNQIAIYTPYHGQRSAIVHALKKVDEHHRPPRYSDVKVQTVKSAQGAEMPCVIISPVRNGSSDYRGANRTGIAGEIHTIYVAITRATHALYIVGHAGFLQSNAQWRHIIDYCQGKYTDNNEDQTD